jgi:hypothetical protein
MAPARDRDAGHAHQDPRRRDELPDVLRGRGPGEILDRLSEGDPLGLWPMACAEIAAEGWMVDPGRLYSRTLARTAYDACWVGPGGVGGAGLEAWLRRRVERARFELCGELAHEEAAGADPAQSPDAEWFTMVARKLKLEPQLARLACVRVNALPRAERRVFRALAFEGRTVEELGAEGFGGPAEVLEQLKRAVAGVLEVLETRRMDGGTWPFPGRGGNDEA